MLSVFRKSLVVFACALVGGVALAGGGGGKAEFADITHQDLMKVVKAKSAVIIDVNGSQSYKEGHIPGAIDFVASKGDLATLLPADKSTLIVAYCRNESCGAYRAAAMAAAKLGYTNVKHYSAGIQGWKESGAPVETAS